MDTLKEKLIQLGYNNAALPQPGGNYLSVRMASGLAYVAIQFPIRGDTFVYQGSLGKEQSTSDGYAAARLAASNILFQLEKYIGLDKVLSINHMDFYYQATHLWDDAPIVANGASDLFVEVLAEAGKHSRAIIGVAQLPRNLTLGLSVVCSIKA